MDGRGLCLESYVPSSFNTYAFQVNFLGIKHIS
ncbi:unnamed protein product, partial [marine sediment metagenome]